jgi:hypothetical protein
MGTEQRPFCGVQTVRGGYARDIYKLKMAVFRVVAPWSLAEVYQCFRGACCFLHLNPEDSHLLTRRRENLKSRIEIVWISPILLCCSDCPVACSPIGAVMSENAETVYLGAFGQILPLRLLAWLRKNNKSVRTSPDRDTNSGPPEYCRSRSNRTAFHCCSCSRRMLPLVAVRVTCRSLVKCCHRVYVTKCMP